LKLKKTLSEEGYPGTGLQVLFEFCSAILAGKADSSPQPPRFELGSRTDDPLVMMTQTLPDVIGQTNVVPAGLRDGNDDVDIMH
jgi:hypothetical protein